MAQAAQEKLDQQRTASPSPATACFVRRYMQRSHRLGADTLTQPVAARADQLPALHFAGPCRIRRAGRIVLPPLLTLAGPKSAGQASLLL